MDFYKSLFQPLLFSLDPERAHNLMKAVAVPAGGNGAVRKLLRKWYVYESPFLETHVAGLMFPNPVGLGAGFDKDGALYSFLANAGFGFIESGTFTAREQPGNPRPRIFRFPSHRALVNRMGFNNPGADKAESKLARHRQKPVPWGINIGKSKVTDLEDAAADYAYTLDKLERYGDYITVNVSSPNTPGLRRLQERGRLSELLAEVKRNTRGYKPVFVKIAPDVDDAGLDDILAVIEDTRLDGIIVSNTTIQRELVPGAEKEQGGLSGAPLREKSTQLIRDVYRRTGGKLPIIGVGGICNGPDALEKIRAGASLIQLYTGYIYGGPRLPAEINAYLADFCERENVSIAALIGSEEPPPGNRPRAKKTAAKAKKKIAKKIAGKKAPAGKKASKKTAQKKQAKRSARK